MMFKIVNGLEWLCRGMNLDGLVCTVSEWLSFSIEANKLQFLVLG